MQLRNENKISVIYIVDANLGIADFRMSEDMAKAGWTVTKAAYEDEYVYFTNAAALKDIAVGTKVNVGGEYNRYVIDDEGIHTGSTGTVDTDKAQVVYTNAAAEAKAIKVAVKDVVGSVFDQAAVTINSLTYDVTITNNASKFAMYVGGDSVASVSPKTITIPVGDKIALTFGRDNVADDTVATVAMTGTEPETSVVTFSSNKATTVAFTPVTNAMTVDSITASYTFTLYQGAAEYWNFEAKDGVNVKTVTAVPGDAINLDIYFSGDPKQLVEDPQTLKGAACPSFKFNGYDVVCLLSGDDIKENNSIAPVSVLLKTVYLDKTNAPGINLVNVILGGTNESCWVTGT